MNKVFCFLCSVVLVFSLVVPCYADEYDFEGDIYDYVEGNIQDISNRVDELAEQVANIPVVDNDTVSDVPSEPLTIDDELSDSTLVDVTAFPLSVVAPVGPSDTEGLKAVLVNFLGEYDPVIVEYRYATSAQGTYQYIREIQPDYVWLCSCGLLVIVIYCVFRVGGAVICQI